ncbi:hypothetical protein RLIN73S_02054 [Rhodanobacter lindaniclasticus]
MTAQVPVDETPQSAIHGDDTRDLPELLPETAHESRSPQEQIRVRADLLDNLVNHAGEVAIYRSRLEQQVAGYRFNLVELEQTVARLRSQLRMLEIETEAQIIARFQREHREAGMTALIRSTSTATRNCSSTRVHWPSRYPIWCRSRACSTS